MTTAYIFQQLSNKAKLEGIDVNIRQKDSRTWYRNAAEQISSVNAQKMMREPTTLQNAIQFKDIGKMFMFFYDPKLKNELPYYDTFPLIFPIEFRNNGFLGINLHYLPHVLRAKLMNAIYSTINNTKYDESTKLKISYSILNSSSKYRYFKPCIKQYLLDHVKSKYMCIEPRLWDAALMLPTERFRKASTQDVWKFSREMI
jgi:hypothetical protein